VPGSPRAGPVQGEQSGKGPASHKLALAMDFPGGSAGKESAHNAGDPGSIPGLGRSPGEGNGRREWLPTPVFWPGEFHGLGLQRVRHD